MATEFLEERVSVEGGTLRVLTAGAGETLVYLHGVGDIGEAFPALTRLAERYRVVRPDHPGFGESDECGVTDVAGIAGVEAGLLDELHVDEFTLVGCSFGGWIAAELALLDPARVKRLVLIDPVGLRGREPGLDMFVASPDELLEATTFDEGRRASARTTTPPPHIAARVARNTATARLLGSDPYMHDPGLAARLARLEVDVLVVWGAHDGVVPPSYAQEWLRALPQARLEVVDAAGHLPQIEQPEQFLAVSGLLDQEQG